MPETLLMFDLMATLASYRVLYPGGPMAYVDDILYGTTYVHGIL